MRSDTRYDVSLLLLRMASYSAVENDLRYVASVFLRALGGRLRRGSSRYRVRSDVA